MKAFLQRLRCSCRCAGQGMADWGPLMRSRHACRSQAQSPSLLLPLPYSAHAVLSTGPREQDGLLHANPGVALHFCPYTQ